jgi:hypothetical protein
MRLAEQRAVSVEPFSRKTYFGDGAWDKRASEALGYDFIAVGRNVKHSTVFDDLSDHEAILEKLGV